MKNKEILNILNTYKASVNIKDDFNNADKLNSRFQSTAIHIKPCRVVCEIRNLEIHE